MATVWAGSAGNSRIGKAEREPTRRTLLSSRAHILPSQYAPAALYHDQYGRRLVTE